jgi:hypothetical protein
VKTFDGVTSDAQDRELPKLLAVGAEVTVVYGTDGVDLLMDDLVNGAKLKERYR